MVRTELSLDDGRGKREKRQRASFLPRDPSFWLCFAFLIFDAFLPRCWKWKRRGWEGKGGKA